MNFLVKKKTGKSSLILRFDETDGSIVYRNYSGKSAICRTVVFVKNGTLILHDYSTNKKTKNNTSPQGVSKHRNAPFIILVRYFLCILKSQSISK